MSIGAADTRVLQNELADIRDELRRVDAKARDLLVVATLAVTIGAAAGSMLHSHPPIVATTGLLLSSIPWTMAVIQLILVIRPMIIADRVPTDDSKTTQSLDSWLLQRWRVLAHIVDVKYTRVRRAVDLLLITLALTATSALLWLLVSLGS